MSDLHRTLTDLEGKDWGPPTYDSHLVTECHRLRHVPLKDLGVEDLGTLIGQEIGLPYLIPVAIDLLREDPCRWIHVPGPPDESCCRSTRELLDREPGGDPPFSVRVG